MKTRTILFVEETNQGKLAKDFREVIKRIEGIIGFKVKVVEKTGSKLKNILSNTDPWAGSHCGRPECITCNQKSEKKPPAIREALYMGIYACSVTLRQGRIAP